MLKTLSLRLAHAAASVPLGVDALKKSRRESSKEGRKLLLDARSDISSLITTNNLKNRGIFARNIKLFFEGPKDSRIDSETTKGRKKLTRERCERICSLRPDGIISWAVAFAPSLWTANLMSNSTFDCVEEQIEPSSAMTWPSEVHDILSALEDEEPLRESERFREFLKGKFHNKHPSKKLMSYSC